MICYLGPTPPFAQLRFLADVIDHLQPIADLSPDPSLCALLIQAHELVARAKVALQQTKDSGLRLVGLAGAFLGTVARTRFCIPGRLTDLLENRCSGGCTACGVW